MKYVHGYSKREELRLNEQSIILENLLHSDTIYPAGNIVLEAGCGVGAQTKLLVRKSPRTKFISLDFSVESLTKAKIHIEKEKISIVNFMNADILNLPFKDESFNHVFVCFVMEHIASPLKMLARLKRVLKPGGTITLIEGDHGSCFWHPETEESLKVWNCLIKVQGQLKHNALIGRQLYPLLKQAGFNIKYVEPRWVYTDSSNPELMDGVLNQIIIPMVKTAKEQSLKNNLIDESTWEKGINDLQISGKPPNGTFFYTWFKGVAVK